MKKRLLISFLSLAMVLGVVARDNDGKKKECDAKSPVAGMSLEQKAQTITDRMVRAYDLTADQSAKLLELNKRMLTQRGPRPDYDKASKCDANKQCGKKNKKDSDKKGSIKDNDKKDKKDKKNLNKDKKDKKEFNKDDKERKGGKRRFDGPGKRPGNGIGRPGYMAALQAIMTPEQFNAYRADKAIERQMFGNGNRRHMPAPKADSVRAGHGSPCCN